MATTRSGRRFQSDLSLSHATLVLRVPDFETDFDGFDHDADYIEPQAEKARRPTASPLADIVGKMRQAFKATCKVRERLSRDASRNHRPKLSTRGLNYGKPDASPATERPAGLEAAPPSTSAYVAGAHSPITPGSDDEGNGHIRPYQAARRANRREGQLHGHMRDKQLEGQVVTVRSQVIVRLNAARDHVGGLRGGGVPLEGLTAVGGRDEVEVYDADQRLILYRGWWGPACERANLELMGCEVRHCQSGVAPTYGPGQTSRGAHASVSYGCTRGSMLEPAMTAYTRKHMADLARMRENLRSTYSLVTKAYEAAHPRHYAHACKVMQELELHCPGVKATFFPFASFCLNYGKRVVASAHIDAQNWANGLCVVVPYGTFDPTQSAKLVLEELGIELEVAPGVPVFFPSALYTHFNTAFSGSDLGFRGSFVGWIGGSLVQYHSLGFTSIKKLKESDPEALEKYRVGKERRIAEGLGLLRHAWDA